MAWEVPQSVGQKRVGYFRTQQAGQEVQTLCQDDNNGTSRTCQRSEWHRRELCHVINSWRLKVDINNDSWD